MTFWSLLEANWDTIYALVSEYHPSRVRLGPRPTITAPRAEAARLEVVALMKEPDPLGKLSLARMLKDEATIRLILNQTWFGIPESRPVPDGFNVLCSLLEDE